MNRLRRLLGVRSPSRELADGTRASLAKLARDLQHVPRIGFSDEPTMCSCGLTWYECRRNRDTR